MTSKNITTKITKTSLDGINLIKEFEGFRSKAYLCPAGVPTIGYGATFYENGKKVALTDPSITEERANSLLLNQLSVFEQYVDSYTRDDITQHQFDALVSFTFNLGPNNLKNSTLLKKVNANPTDKSIANEFVKWINSNGKPLDGLLKRRKAESALYFS